MDVPVAVEQIDQEALGLRYLYERYIVAIARGQHHHTHQLLVHDPRHIHGQQDIHPLLHHRTVFPHRHTAKPHAHLGQMLDGVEPALFFRQPLGFFGGGSLRDIWQTIVVIGAQETAFRREHRRYELLIIDPPTRTDGL